MPLWGSMLWAKLRDKESLSFYLINNMCVWPKEVKMLYHIIIIPFFCLMDY